MGFHELKQSIKQLYTLDNIVLLVALLIATSWLWGTMGTLQNNFRLQTEVNTLSEEVAQSKLEAENLELENQYFASQEYLELQARQRLNKAAPGEHLLILPASTVQDKELPTQIAKTPEQSNFQAWINFFFANH